ncbi:type I-C CRISPR-associated protein Cas8c/Csd1 [Psychromonas antarctica]|uniref:type I-C CRISPR-associated protein Cas8c/Csd1 n=1 Tax=Psychromonas antarctica TaxID=67573 RepID=UPI001EE8E7BD|nr:type I-C CRISPR-associated protein Cas8c/Csd1 [Psychromonas antarctica]MCG6201147.1 type I-C CRISPR-associated protein Cas8c/Csd1 [Psychromonas antarctica]
MSWMQKLYETYEQGLLLEIADDQKPMPISHTLQNAHINIVINGEGDFLRAEVLEKIQVILPATEKSAGRSSGLSPHPLADKIQYVAGDYIAFGGIKKSGFSLYKELLSAWCGSPYSHLKAKAVLKYIDKETVISDLIKHNIIFQENSVLLTKWNDEDEMPKLFKVLPKEKGVLDQGSALVCWTVEIPADQKSKTWLDNSLQQSWIEFDASDAGDSGLCLVKGEHAVLAVNHPAKIRHSGDKAKLISANDSSGFTFRGKFLKSEQATGVSFEVTQKAHNALRWLLGSRKQGFRNGDQVYVSWAVSGKKIPEPMADPFSSMFSHQPYIEPEADQTIDLGYEYAQTLKRYMSGFIGQEKLQINESIVLMGIDSATPGRMGIIYYRETIAQEFIDTLTKWHEDFAWPQRQKREIENGKKKIPQTFWPISAPAPYKIWSAVYGDVLKSNDTLKKNLMERLMPCIVEGKLIPIDVVNYAVKRATNRVAYQSGDSWLWEQNLGIACALYKGFCKRTTNVNFKKEYKMALEEDNNSRDYLYGRLLAVAERIEQVALSVSGEKRATTAERMMQRFADRPFSTWRNIELALRPYMQRLQNTRTGFLVNRQKELDNILNAFNSDEFKSEKPLSGEFLLGFHCQRLALTVKKETLEINESN